MATLKFPAIRGKMGSRTFYTVNFTLRAIPRFLQFTDPEMPPELRAQRKLTKSRVPEIAQYLIDNEKDWVFSSLAAAYRDEPDWTPSELDENVGVLEFPYDARFLLADGQHRRAGIERALEQDPTIGDQNVSVVLFPEENLKRDQQIFSDLNRTARKTSRSLDILYDLRDPMNRITYNEVAEKLPIFHGRTEMEAPSLSPGSAKFVTLAVLYKANSELLGKLAERDVVAEPSLELEKAELARDFWTAITKNIPEWTDVAAGELKPAVARQQYIHSHSVGMIGLGIAGRDVVERQPKQWPRTLEKLSEVDWRKVSAAWQGINMIGGDVVSRRQTMQATGDMIKYHLGIGEKPKPVLRLERKAA